MEFYHNCKENGWIYGLKLLVTGCLFCFLYATASYFFATQALNERFFDQSEDTMIRLIDEVVEAADFTAYLNNSDKLATVSDFYTMLNSQTAFTYLTMSAQPLLIANFHQPSQFYYDMNGDGLSDADEATLIENGITYTNVKTLALNQAAFTYYQVADDELINWEALDFAAEIYPVVLGNNYAADVAIGERFEGSYITEPFTLEVVGFLPPASSVFYQGELNFYLDDYVLFPYPEQLSAVTSEDSFFERAVRFNLINGDIISTKSFDEIVTAVNHMAVQSDFYEYTFINVPSFYLQNNHLRIALNENQTLILFLSSFFVGFSLIITTAFNRLLYQKRLQVYQIHYLSGESFAKLQRRFMFEGVYDCLLLPIVVLSFGLTQKMFDARTLLLMSGLFTIWVLIALYLYVIQFNQTAKGSIFND